MINLPDKQICEDYINGMTSYELAEKYNCSCGSILRRLRKFNVDIRDNIIKLPIDIICEEYVKGVSATILGKRYDCSPITIIKRLKSEDITIRDSGRKKVELPIDIVSDEYMSGINSYELAKKYNCSRYTILEKLHENSDNIRLPIDLVYDDYMSGMSSIKLGKKYNCCNGTILRELEKYGAELRTVSESRNVVTQCVCINCGHTFDGRCNSKLCPDCNESGYCYKFDSDCKRQNRNKYNNECFFCGCLEEENGRKHDIHHVDYNKNQGCGETPDWKLVPLCKSCHGVTGGDKENRDLWEARILYLHRDYWGD